MYNLKDLLEYAKEKNGECLSESYTRCDKMYQWKCSEGHVWKTSWSNIKRDGGNKWCKECKSTKIEDLQKLAEGKGGKCLSDKYINIETNYDWECDRKHQWRATWLNIKHNKTWCKKCVAGLWDISWFQEFAEEKGGKCLKHLSGNGRSNAKFLWECKDRHQWEATGGNIVMGRWCPACRKLTIEEMQELAEKKGGKCLSDTYINKRTPLLWECKEGHQWKALPGGVKNNNSWCAKCRYESLKLGLDYAKELAIKREGKCLSTEYINYPTLMSWECKNGHIWETSIAVLQRGAWCPKCRYKSESMCRDIMEEYMGYKFPKRRLNCMEYLEFDGYSEEVKLAFEYNGIQHDKYTPYFHKNGERDFEEQCERDLRKISLSKENNIQLITIPPKYSYQRPKELRRFIYDSLLDTKFLIEIFV